MGVKRPGPAQRGAAGRARAPSRASGTVTPGMADVVEQIRRLDRGLRLAAREVEAVIGASAAQLFVLEQLAGARALSIGEIAKRTLTDRSSVSAVVDRLAERGLVARRPSDEDRRRAEVRVTPAGRALLARAPAAPTARLLAALAALPPSTVAHLARDLARLNEALGLGGAPAPLLFGEEER